MLKLQYGIETIEHDNRQVIEWFNDWNQRNKIYELKVKFNKGQFAALKIFKIQRYIETSYIRTELTNYLGDVKKLNERIDYN